MPYGVRAFLYTSLVSHVLEKARAGSVCGGGRGACVLGGGRRSLLREGFLHQLDVARVEVRPVEGEAVHELLAVRREHRVLCGRWSGWGWGGGFR